MGKGNDLEGNEGLRGTGWLCLPPLGMRGCVCPCHHPRWQEHVPRAAWQQGLPSGERLLEQRGGLQGASLVVAFQSTSFIYSFVVLLPPSCHSEGLFRKSPGSALQTAACELFRGYRAALTSLTAVIKGCCGLVSGSISFLNYLLSM